MTATYSILNTNDAVFPDKLQQEFALDTLIGLSESPKRLFSRYFYDGQGSKIFEEITQLSEYYLTASELEILQNYSPQIITHLDGQPLNLVELGPGDGHKTSYLIQHLRQIRQEFLYIPMDISAEALQNLVLDFANKYPTVRIEGLVCDYFDGLKWLNQKGKKRNLVLFLGSNIGNFSRALARQFLYSLWNSLQAEDLVLIGFDLRKDVPLLMNAYNDSQGVTARFNLNLLQRINDQLGGNFELSKFRFYCTYDVYKGAMESYLISTLEQTVNINALSQSFHFQAWEPIHTEYSYKYFISDIEQMALETGFEIKAQFFDRKCYFVDSLWQVKKKSTLLGT